MIECNFEYNDNLIKNINSMATKRYNIIIEIAMFIIFVSTLTLFATHNNIIGFVFAGLFVTLLAVLVIINIILSKNNSILVGQKINIKFNKESLVMQSKLGNKKLYNAEIKYNVIKKVEINKDLLFLYIDKDSVLVIPKISFKSENEYNTATQLVQDGYVF